MKVGLDTNVLVYAEGVNTTERRIQARTLIEALSDTPLVVPMQALKELFNTLMRKGRWTAEAARGNVREWREAAEVAETSENGLMTAIDLVVDHRLPIWDALILAAAAEAGCRLQLSEDMQAGFIWRGLTVVNPFAATRSPLLESALRK